MVIGIRISLAHHNQNLAPFIHRASCPPLGPINYVFVTISRDGAFNIGGIATGHIRLRHSKSRAYGAIKEWLEPLLFLPVSAKAGMTATVEVTPVGSEKIRYSDAILIDEYTYDIDVNNKVTLSTKNGLDLIKVVSTPSSAGTKQWSVKEIKVQPGSVVEEGEVIAVLRNFDNSTKNVKSPVAGTIREILTAPEALVANSVATIGSGPMIASIKVSEYDISNVALDQKVDLKLGNSSEVSAGKVSQIGQVATTDTNGVAQFIVFTQPDAAVSTWRIGMSVTAKIILQSKKAAVAVPLQALIKKGNLTFVQILDINNNPVDKEVKTGVTGSKLVEILSGINLGDEVVLGKKSADGKLPTTEDPFADQRPDRNDNRSSN